MKKTKLLLILMLSLSRVFDAAVTFDAASSTQGEATSYTFSHTCTGTDRVLIVGIGSKTTGGNPFTGVTYNSVAMTQAGVTITGQTATYIYYLLNPSTGANNVVASSSAANPTIIGAASYTGVSGVGAFVAVTSAAATISTGYTTTVDNAWLAAIVDIRVASTTYTNNSGSTTRWGPLSEGSGANAISGIQVDQIAAVTAGANTVSFTASNSGTQELAVIELQPGAAPAAAARLLNLMGVGQ